MQEKTRWTKSFLFLLLLLPVTVACNGGVSIRPIVAASNVENGSTDNKIPVDNSYSASSGVIIYPPTYVKSTFKTTTYINAQGIVEATHDGTIGVHCIPIETEELSLAADLSRPHIIDYKPGVLESYKFSVTLNNGMLASMNTESSPDRGETLKNVASAAGEVFGVESADKNGKKFCNKGKVLTCVTVIEFPFNSSTSSGCKQ